MAGKTRTVGSILCNEDNCNERFITVNQFRQHLIKHGKHHPCIKEYFKTKEDMEKWIEDYEDKYKVNFRQTKPGSKGQVYYRCNRDKEISSYIYIKTYTNIFLKINKIDWPITN